MIGDIQMELYLNEYKMKALSSVLVKQGSNVEERMQKMLNDLYTELVPVETRQKIQTRIDEEYAEERARQEAAKKYAVFRLREKGADRFLQLDQGLDFLNAACLLRTCLRSGGGVDEYMKLLGQPEVITADQFRQMAAIRMENPGRVTGAFELDFDSRRCSTLHTMNGWMAYDMKDVSAAAYHAQRKQYTPYKAQLDRFTAKLDGKALAYQPPPFSSTFLRGSRRLRPDDISFAEEISEIKGQLNFYMETSFDVDAVFGTRICTEENDDTLNVYADYDMAAGQIHDTLEVNMHWADGREEPLKYQLNDAEKAILLQKMDAYCQEQTGQTLEEYSARLMAGEEKQAPAPQQQEPQTGGPSLLM